MPERMCDATSTVTHADALRGSNATVLKNVLNYMQNDLEKGIAKEERMC